MVNNTLVRMSEEEKRKLAATFKALADPTRLSLLHVLMHGDMNVTDLARNVGHEDSVSAVSHHLRILRSLDVVRDRRDGKQVIYSIHDDHIASILEQSLAHIGHH